MKLGVKINTTDINIKRNKVIFYKRNNKKYPLINIGRGSIVNDAIIKTNYIDEDELLESCLFSIQIGQFSTVNEGVEFILDEERDFNNLTNSNCKLLNIDLDKKGREILICNDVIVGKGSTILKGVTIYDGAIVQNNSTVIDDVPPYAIVAGNPAKVVGYRFDKEIIDKLLSIRWWEWSNEEIVQRNKWINSCVTDFCDEFFENSLSKINSIAPLDIPNVGKKFLFLLDLDEEYCIWEKIVCEFIDKHRNNEDYLLLYIEESIANKLPNIVVEINEYIDNLLQKYNSKCSVGLCIENIENQEAMFKSVDYYITNRSSENIRYTCYAKYYNVKKISGFKDNVFVKKMNKYINSVNKKYNKYLAIGNSITKHPICEYWWGRWGMAASSEDKDYVHIVAKKLSENVDDFSFQTVNFANWERAENRKNELKTLDFYLDEKVDLVTIFLGENVSSLVTIEYDFIILIEYIKQRCKNVDILIIGNFWENAQIDMIKERVAELYNIPFIKLSDKYYNDFYKSEVLQKVQGEDGKEHIIENNFVAEHPGDAGMQAIANEIIKRLV